MKKLSTGQDSTLGNWLMLTELAFGKNSPQADFLKDKIDESPNGKDEEVLADEGQLIQVLIDMGQKDNALH